MNAFSLLFALFLTFLLVITGAAVSVVANWIRPPDGMSQHTIVKVLLSLVLVSAILTLVSGVAARVSEPDTSPVPDVTTGPSDTRSPRVPTSTTSSPRETTPTADDTSEASPTMKPKVIPEFVVPGMKKETYCHNTTVDLDTPSTKDEYYVAQGGDLEYHCDAPYQTIELRSNDAKTFGYGPSQQPSTSEDCVAFANTHGIGGSLDPAKLKANETSLCVVTDAGRTVWMKYLGQSRSATHYPSLRFRLVIWEN